VIILCDTSSVVMLLRVAPEMFQDERYGCVTIKEVHDELFATQKFKNRYPWRTDYRDKVVPLAASQMEVAEVSQYFSVIDELVKAGTIDRKSGRLFDLSHTDKRILAGALAYQFKITSGDQGLIRFAKQEFPSVFKGDISPLEIINMWLEKGLISWDNVKHGYLSEWDRLEEPAQPIEAIGKFQQFTRKIYPGS
jgi:hypothetical protein